MHLSSARVSLLLDSRSSATGANGRTSSSAAIEDSSVWRTDPGGLNHCNGSGEHFKAGIAEPVLSGLLLLLAPGWAMCLLIGQRYTAFPAKALLIGVVAIITVQIIPILGWIIGTRNDGFELGNSGDGCCWPLENYRLTM